MSHFTVLVTKTNHKDLERQLEPFNEDRETPRYVKYTKEQLIAKGRADIEEYRNGRYAEFLKDPDAYKASCSNPQHIKYLKSEFPLMLDWDDEQVYQHEIRWYEADEIGPDGEVYSTRNPNSKWDWYQVGGRWAGFFIPKAGAAGAKGQITLLASDEDKRAHAEGLGVDIIKVGDIDWDAMDEAKRKRRAEYFDEEMGKPEDRRFFWDDEKPTDRQSYIDRPVVHSTFAVLHNGVWYEKGEMGWWGAVSNPKDQDAWDSEWRKLIEGLDPEDEVTLVDCHI